MNVHGAWVVRRLPPDSRKIEIEELRRSSDLNQFLEAMGFELGNIHLATPRRRSAILRDLAPRAALAARGNRVNGRRDRARLEKAGIEREI